jgi:hypothetical protein
MTTKQILAAMKSGSTLCLGYGEHGPTWWLHPSRVIVRSDVAEKIRALPGIEPSGDSLFHDFCSQTWKLNGRARP